MSVRRHIHPDPETAAQACAHAVVALLEQVLAGQEFATLAVSGGSTPKRLFHQLVKSPFRWQRVHLFWVDERCVPPADDQSNFKLAEQNLIVPAHLPQRQVHRICGELMPDLAAQRYVDDIRDFFALQDGELPRFDLLQLGMGPDAHTASLFPGEPLIQDRESIAASVYVDKVSQWRVTLLPGVLLNSRHTMFLVAGADKAHAVRSVFQDDYDPLRYPAQTVSHHARSVDWFMDGPAASLTD